MRTTQAGWVAGGVRARLLARRRIGLAGARRLAQQPTLDAALGVLAASPYARGLREGMTLRDAQHAVSGATLRYLRFMAGWLPPAGDVFAHDLAGWWELENIEALLGAFAGAPAPRPHVLGTLGSAWPRIATTRSVPELRAALRTSAWGDPGTSAPDEILTALRLRLAERVARHGERARRWAAARALIVLAARRFADGRRPRAATIQSLHALGAAWNEPRSLGALAQQQAGSLGWVLEGIAAPRELWRAEARWWRRVEQEAGRAMRGALADADVVLGAIGLLGADAWRTKAALALAARGGGPVEAFDALV